MELNCYFKIKMKNGSVIELTLEEVQELREKLNEHFNSTVLTGSPAIFTFTNTTTDFD